METQIALSVFLPKMIAKNKSKSWASRSNCGMAQFSIVLRENKIGGLACQNSACQPFRLAFIHVKDDRGGLLVFDGAQQAHEVDEEVHEVEIERGGEHHSLAPGIFGVTEAEEVE